MEISRLRAELARVKMERDILGKATAYFGASSVREAEGPFHTALSYQREARQRKSPSEGASG